MPRVSSKQSVENRAPRRRVEKRVSKVSGRVGSGDKEEKEVVLSSENNRKAPAVFSEEKISKKKFPKKVFLLSLTVVACFVLAILIGNSGEGQIDTVAKIAENTKRVANSSVEFDEQGNEIKRDEVVPPPVVPASKLKPRGVGTAKIESPKLSEEELGSMATSSEDGSKNSENREEDKDESESDEKSLELPNGESKENNSDGEGV